MDAKKKEKEKTSEDEKIYEAVPEIKDPALGLTEESAAAMAAAPQEEEPVAEAPAEQATPAVEKSVPLPEQTPAAPAQDLSATAPASDEIVVTGRRSPAENNMQRLAESYAFSNDLSSGKIKPETYESLYAKQDTLGKIGTLFGLLVSGAGAGLSKQPNIVLEMMNKEIARDLDAQKTNQASRQNWYNAAVAHERSLADIDLQNATTAATNAGTYSKALEAEVEKWKLHQLPGIIDMSASTMAQNNMMNAYLQRQQDAINRMAPGATKNAAQNTLDTVIKPAVNQKIQQNIDILSKKKGAYEAMHPNPLDKALDQGNPADPRGPVVNQNLYQQKIALGRIAPYAPGAIPPEQVPAVNAEISMIKLNRQAYADYIDSFQKLQQMRMAGQLPGAKVAGSLAQTLGGAIGSSTGPMGALVGGIIGKSAGDAAQGIKDAYELDRARQVESFKQRIGSKYSENEKNRLVEAMFPSWVDSSASMEEAFRKGEQHFSSQEAAPNMEQYGIITPFPKVPFQSFQKKDKEKKK